MQLAFLVGWKWIVRFLLFVFWVVAIILALTGHGIITWLFRNHVTTSIALMFLTIYFFFYPFLVPFLPIVKTRDGGETMNRSTKIIAVAFILLLAITIVAIFAPGAVVNFTQGTIVAPIVAAFIGFVHWLDGFRASYLLAAGLIGGLFLAIAIKMLDPKRRIANLRGTSTTTYANIMAREPAEPERVAPPPPKVKQAETVEQEA